MVAGAGACPALRACPRFIFLALTTLPVLPLLEGTCELENLTATCVELGEQAKHLCLEYQQFKIQGDLCYPWKQDAYDACMKFCADCRQVALGVREICRFQLQSLGNGPLVTRFCTETREAMEFHRCPAVTLVNQSQCQSEEGRKCMRDCGNFGTCQCRERKGTGLPPFCLGTPRSQDIPGTTDTITCDQMPEECYHFRPSSCGKYHYCRADMCIIEQVECIPKEDCLEFDLCEPGSGLCYFKYRKNGHNCSDGIFYTLDDQCIDGLCKGTPDFCLRYNTTCKPHSPCVTDGLCHSHSGRCTYNMSPDGVTCDDGRPYTLEDQCQKGSCIGKPVDLCVERGVVCAVPNSCYDPGVCDRTTGWCSDAVPAREPRPCDDGDPATINDICIDGVCLGQLSTGEEFLTLGTGECTDREGNRMGRYSGDVEDEQECLRLCREDPQCAAYSYAYPLCSIYGTVRTLAPASARQWAYQEGSSSKKAVAVEMVALTATGQRRSICRRRGVAADVPVDLGSLADFTVKDFFEPWKVGVFFLVLAVIFFCLPISRAVGRCINPGRMQSALIDPNIGAQAARGFAYADGEPPQGQLRKLAAGDGAGLQAYPPDCPGSPAEPPDLRELPRLPGQAPAESDELVVTMERPGGAVPRAPGTR